MLKYRSYVPFVLLCLYFIKVSLQPIGYPEAFILLILSSLTGYLEYKNQDKKLKDLEDKINTTSKLMEEKAKDIDNLKIAVATSKLSSNFGQINGARR